MRSDTEDAVDVDSQAEGRDVRVEGGERGMRERWEGWSLERGGD